MIIQDNKDGSTDVRSVALLEAFKIGNEQHAPQRNLAYKTKLGYAVDDPTVGSHDDEKVYFIFDYDNRLMYDDDNGDIEDFCELIDHLDENKVENDDESIHFLMGQEFTEYDIDNIICHNHKPDQIKENTFFNFDEELLFSVDRMERVYDITCPAIVEADEGTLNLGNHVQWIDLSTVEKCHLQYYSYNGDKTKQDHLDITSSWIEVRDYINDDNTFKINDYLLTSENIFEDMKKLGCTAPVVKVVRVKRGREMYDEEVDERPYQILKLFLTLPTSPMEYILDADADGDAKLDLDDQHIDPYNNPYNSAYNDEFYGISIEKAGMEYSDSLDEDELYEYIYNGIQKSVTQIDHDRDGIYSANYFDNEMLDDFDYYEDEENGQTINLYYDSNELYQNDIEEDFYKFMDEYENGYYSDDDEYYLSNNGYFDDFQYTSADDDDEEDDYEMLDDHDYYEGFISIYDLFDIDDDDLQYLDANDLEELYEVYDDYMTAQFGKRWKKVCMISICFKLLFA